MENNIIEDLNKYIRNLQDQDQYIKDFIYLCPKEEFTNINKELKKHIKSNIFYVQDDSFFNKFVDLDDNTIKFIIDEETEFGKLYGRSILLDGFKRITI